MRTFFDFEFIENGDKHPIIPVSVGLVREDGKEYYAEFEGVDWSLANDWVIENVKPTLGRVEPLPKNDIAADIISFVGYNPEFWAYYADYDWVIMCGLYGPMVLLPEGWPMICYDIRQYMYHLGLDSKFTNSIPNKEEHHALADAIWNMEVFNKLLGAANV